MRKVHFEVGYRIHPATRDAEFTTPYYTLGNWDTLGEAQLACHRLMLDCPTLEVRILECRL